MSEETKNKRTGNKRLRTGLVVGFLALLLIVGGVAGYFTKVKTVEGSKEFTITVISERDNFDKTIECKSDLGTLGEYVRTMDECVWEDSDYGTYITGWYDMSQDLENQYWWCITIDNKENSNGADLIPLEEGRDYEFTLKQGW